MPRLLLPLLLMPLVAAHRMPPVRPPLARLQRLRGGAEGGGLGFGSLSSSSANDVSLIAAAAFGNLRVPAALVAGACVPLGFIIALPTKEDTPRARVLKQLCALTACLAIFSELLSISFATNAISDLQFRTDWVAHSLTDLLTRPDTELRGHWVGVNVR